MKKEYEQEEILEWDILDIDDIENLTDEKLIEETEGESKCSEEIPKKKSFLRELVEWVVVLCAGVVIALFISNHVILNAHIPSGSMEQTIAINDRVIGLRVAYLFSEPQRGDIAIFKFPDNEERIYIKRIIGVPGDTIRLSDGKVYVNGSETPLEEPYTVGETRPGRAGVKEYIVPEDSYFMLGDNRENSEDSRFWVNTFVKKEKILAKAVVRYYPQVDMLDDYHD